MNTLPRSIVILGLSTIALGFVYGLGYTYIVEHTTLLELKDGYAGDFLELSEQSLRGKFKEDAVEAVALTGQSSVRYRRAVGAHTHAINLGLLIIIFAPIFSVSMAGCRRGRWVARMFAAGAVVYPLSLAAQALGWTLAGEVFAVLGSGAVIASLAIVLLRLFLSAPVHTE